MSSKVKTPAGWNETTGWRVKTPSGWKKVVDVKRKTPSGWEFQTGTIQVQQPFQQTYQQPFQLQLLAL